MNSTASRNVALAVSVLACGVLAPASAAREEPKKPAGAWAVMDYGPFLSATVGAAKPSANVATKGIAVRLGEKGDAGVLFDTDLLRMAAGWTGGFLKLQGVAFDGAHGPHPQVAGDIKFGTSQTPGWARPGTKDFADSRDEPFGPLPRQWAKYRGLYLHGSQVVLSYTVGRADVLEAPGVEWVREGEGRAAFFTRSFKVGPSDHPLTMLVAETDGGGGRVADPNEVRPENEEWPQSGPAKGTVAILQSGGLTAAGFHGDVEGAAWEIVKGGNRPRIQLTVPPRDKPVTFQVILWGGKAAPGNAATRAIKERLAAAGKPVDFSALTAGGPPRWEQTLSTKGTLGDAKGGAYAVDTITVPADNPWKSWLRFGGFDFFKGGKSAALCTWSGDVWTVSGIDEKLEKLTWKRFATGLHQPLGLKIVDDKVYVHGRDQITRLHDLNGDGEADFYENFNNDVHATPGFHEFAYDLQTDPEGNFYLIKGGPVNSGGSGFQRLAAHHGTLMKLSKDGTRLEVIATGFRAPNGIGVGPNGELTSGDNEGTWTPACRLNWIKPGGFYGVVDLAHRAPPPTTTDNPLCWLPKSWDNSSGGQVWVTSDRWGPLKGELLHMSYGQSALYLVLRDECGGEMQGGVTRLPLKFESSLMRGRFNDADGQLYVCGLQGWQTNAAKATAFQRVRYVPDKPLYVPRGMRVKEKGIELTFSQPLDPETANDAGSYDIQQWNYRWSSGYGSDEYKPSNGQKGRDTLEVKSAKLSEDRRTVYLETPALKPVMQVLIRTRLDAADGTEIDAEIAGTINCVPPDQKMVVTAPAKNE